MNLYKVDEKPTNRQNHMDRASYVAPLFPKAGFYKTSIDFWKTKSNHLKNGFNCMVPYIHNGWAFKLEAGTYLLSVLYHGFNNRRKYTIRAIGDDLTLEMLHWLFNFIIPDLRVLTLEIKLYTAWL